ncbi:tRNA1(Val) (adenine(37)-N6)-methyltransferase [Hoeflea prorocentri]|uniref:Methyltransferase n=1 Tax=Hoeflea prorocentri TaxID=1922333 RepID=A0A9X3UI16_9HYPH|nr:methyltransferase [Hoeflea prorocentri]MCY6381707.1 methyltransferase [Hoeflea prorocentri]MDA5399507.1 methyltransferase [Hoeflea prorocentri]
MSSGPGENRLPEATVDAFHRGRFFLAQPRGKGHRAGIDAMLLASLVPPEAKGRLADFGAGCGAAGIAVASRTPDLEVILVERSREMAQFARQSAQLPQNAEFAKKISIVEADVTLSGRERIAAGLADAGFDHIIMNPPFNDAADRVTPDRLKAEAHAMPKDMWAQWIRTAGAVCKPGGQLSLIARPQSLEQILAACTGRFGGLHIVPVHPRPGEEAIRILASAIAGSRARLSIRPPLFVHDDKAGGYSPFVDDLINGRAFLARR